MTKCPSAAANAANGVIDGWRAPSGPGTSPVAAYRAIAFSRIATWQSSMDTSILVASPVFARSNSALQMPMAVNSPAVTSPIDVPTRVGGPPGWPVMLMTPPIACTTMSYAGRVASGPVWPKPDTAA